VGRFRQPFFGTDDSELKAMPASEQPPIGKRKKISPLFPERVSMAAIIFPLKKQPELSGGSRLRTRDPVELAMAVALSQQT